MVAEKALNMTASRAMPATVLCRNPGRMASAPAASSSNWRNSETSGAKASAASVGWLVRSCWAKSTIIGPVGVHSTGSGSGRGRQSR